MQSQEEPPKEIDATNRERSFLIKQMRSLGRGISYTCTSLEVQMTYIHVKLGEKEVQEFLSSMRKRLYRIITTMQKSVQALGRFIGQHLPGFKSIQRTTQQVRAYARALSRKWRSMASPGAVIFLVRKMYRCMIEWIRGITDLLCTSMSDIADAVPSWDPRKVLQASSVLMQWMYTSAPIPQKVIQAMGSMYMQSKGSLSWQSPLLSLITTTLISPYLLSLLSLLLPKALHDGQAVRWLQTMASTAISAGLAKL